MHGINNFTKVIVDAAKDILSMQKKKGKQKRKKIKPKIWYDKSFWHLKKEIDQVSRCVLRHLSYLTLRGKLHNLNEILKNTYKEKEGRFQI